MAKKYVYKFSEGNGKMRELLGGKGANLAEMSNLGMPVPDGFTITTEACTAYYADGETINDTIMKEIRKYVVWLQKETGKKLGDLNNPLLVSVRSGARASMPGMMDTILNLGMNDEVVKVVEKKSGSKRFAYDSYRRFVQMFSDVVMGLSKAKFETIIDDVKAKRGVKLDIDLTAEDMEELTVRFKKFYKDNLHEDFPQDPQIQLERSIEAVFRSWNNERAIFYRKMNDIPGSWGTAVSVMEMVFGNMGDDCGTGVAFTRNPATGEKKLFGEFLMNAQGEDVVAGIRTPQPISELKKTIPAAFKEFVSICDKLEKHYHDMQDMEFTIEHGKLFMLQTRNAKRTAAAALKVAVDMEHEGLVTRDQALLMVEPKQLDDLLHPMFDAKDLKAAEDRIIAKGLAASPGAGSGEVVFSAEEAKKKAAAGKKVVLVRLETSPEDIEGMHVSQAIVTVRGGMTSHAAVVARGMGACCVSGCGEISVDEEKKQFTVKGQTFKDGDIISVDGSTGIVYRGEIHTVPATISGNFKKFMDWADERRTLKIRTNADTPADAARALSFGAEGVGLVRTEHMFFNSAERIKAIRMLCVSQTPEQRQKALDLLEPYQKEDFEGIFEALKGRSVTIRLLDPPLHEFLPKTDAEAADVAKTMGITVADVEAAAVALKEFNPMMGHRGCRLDVTYPEIGEMQTRAIINAAIDINKKHRNWHLEPEIMIPLVGEKKELDYVANIIRTTADKVIAEKKANLKYHIGTMIEIPRAAVVAGELAETAEFFSFGTNDLTQMTFGFSRDDAGKFLGDYYDKHIYESDPFAHVDVNGVGALIKMAASQGRATRKDIHLGVCGEHGGDPASIEFFQRVGLDYVSCSPFRVPLARLAAAQAAIHADAEKKASGTVKKTGKKASKKTVAKKASVKKTVAKKTAAKKTAVKKTVKKTAKKAAAKTAKKTVKKPVKKASASKKKTRK
ncbi:MAG: pyruvate, phosphate dikinase [Solobacterium sp.]|nr:pyruvate, phosphate dikinase [Solobacterium sp.]MCH4205624.1 pyruvate, phosphate dikinase [Solobacterium sp.]MCH4227183.1 pyruvate, phosphate dikinase [Solobacterium sp.]MCH4282454.1 pyruvate, phosphate dikinase [Solobacterium sp.]